MKTALQLAGGVKQQDFFGDEIVPSSELEFDLMKTVSLSALAKHAALCPVVATAYACRHVRSFTREPMQMRQDDWVLAAREGVCHVGRISEMIEFFTPHHMSLMRILLCDARCIEHAEDRTRGNVVIVRKDVPVCEVYVEVEYTSLHEVVIDERQDELLFNYVF